jgi:hypothetical protein
MAQVVNASRKTYESLQKHYNLAVKDGRTGFSLWGKYMTLKKAETIMDMIRMSLGLSDDYVQRVSQVGKPHRRKHYEKPIPDWKITPLDLDTEWRRNKYVKQLAFLRMWNKMEELGNLKIPQ